MRILFAIFVFLVSSQSSSDVVNDPVTGEQVRASCDIYDVAVTNEIDFDEYFSVEAVVSEPEEFFNIEPYWGPDRESFYKVLEPDRTIPSADYNGWEYVIFVRSNAETSLLVKVKSSRGTVIPYWKAKKSIQIEVWRGRIAESIFLISTATGEVLSAENRNYFELTLRCLN